MKEKKESKKKKEGNKLPDHIELQRTHVVCGTERNHHVNTLTSANMFRPLGIDNAWDLEAFKEGFQIKIQRVAKDYMQFDMIGCDPAIANALRRILIAEIPTIAIEHVFIINNTSIIQDEVLAHRLGLIPLQIDPEVLEFKSPEEIASEKNTLVFKLDVTCKKSAERVDKIINEKVLSSMLQWLPAGSEIPEETGARFAAGQMHLSAGGSSPKPVDDDILLAKLRPGQTISLEAHCTKGVGKEHAKWSPVATAWYRLLPEMRLIKDDVDDLIAEELLAAAPGLFIRHPSSGKLTVTNARDHEKHLEKIRLMLDREEISECVQLLKRKDHFIFTIESTGILTPEQLLTQAIDILQGKAERLAEKL